MAEQEVTKSNVSIVKCPNCGADMTYNPSLGALHCEYCDTSLKPETTRGAFSRDLFTEREEGEVEGGASVFRCPNCGGEAEIDNFDSTVECPFCGATNIVKTDSLKGLKPDTILPFAVSKEQAYEFGRKWIKKRLYAPRKLKRDFTANRFKGVYSPSFIFGTSTYSSYEGKLGENYTVTVRTSKGVRTEVRTRWFFVSGNYSKAYRDVVVEASSALEQKEMNKILPYDLDNKEQYKKEYLAGFAAERYSSSLDDSFGTAKAMIEPDIRQSILAQYKYDVIGYLNVNTTYADTRFNYTLLPIWLCGYKYREKLYHFIVNGRTGKSTGKFPVSVAKVLITVAAALGIVAFFVWLFMYSGLA